MNADVASGCQYEGSTSSHIPEVLSAKLRAGEEASGDKRAFDRSRPCQPCIEGFRRPALRRANKASTDLRLIWPHEFSTIEI
ncbi:hypothetical protein SY26_06045 [Paracoccus sp. 228]|nr:hypothetical protein SY26_06045 [Paracoccus sp. 228]